MKIAVIGLYHLGCVTAACMADAGHEVLGFDPDPEQIDALRQNKTPIFEPGLDDLLLKNTRTKKLNYSSDPRDISQSDILWITFDTPVDENDVADVESVLSQVKKLLPFAKHNALLLISSQIPVGTTRKLQEFCVNHFPEKNIFFGYSPENLRLGNAIKTFTQPDRVIVGIDDASEKSRIQQLFHPLTDHIIWMSIESAEMTKHALNAFLATSVVFINELSSLCERVGANAREVEQGLKSELRIGKKAYLRPGNAIGGGTLLRDVGYLIQLGEQKNYQTNLFSAVLESNHYHKQWTQRKLTEMIKNFANKKITALGLTYKAGTDSLRRSTTIELCQWLNQQGARVHAYDPVLATLPDDLTQVIKLENSLNSAIQQSDAVLISTEWPEFSTLTTQDILTLANTPLVIDPSGFLAEKLSHDPRIQYISVGGTI